VRDERCDLLCVDLPRAEEIRRGRLDARAAHEAAERARALSDPTRLTLAAALGEGGELCGCDLAWISERAQNLVSHHLRVLLSKGLVTSRREGKIVFYSLTQSGCSLLAAVLGEKMKEVSR
jgi:ArsR family transcriptional regulator, lead/cadmium/zinc/bismuth-responsive transcriptional repressor